MDVEIKQMPAMRVACVRHIGPYNTVSEAFGTLNDIAGRAGMFTPPVPMMVGLYHDDPDTTPASDLRSDAGLVVAEDAPIPAGLAEVRVPAGTYACVMHVGPYDKLPDTWMWLMGQWMPKSGRTVRNSASIEVYHNNPMNTPKDQLQTEICVPVD